MQSLQCMKVPADAPQGISRQSQTRAKNICHAYFRGMPNLARSLYIKHGFSHCDFVQWFCILKHFVECKSTDTCWLDIVNTFTGGNLQVPVPMKAAKALTLSFPQYPNIWKNKKFKVTPYSCYEGRNYPITPGCKHAFSAVCFGVFTLESMGTDLRLQRCSTGHRRTLFFYTYVLASFLDPRGCCYMKLHSFLKDGTEQPLK